MSDVTDTSVRLEALLFAAGEPLSYTKLRQLLSVDNAELTRALGTLQARLTGGVRLMTTDAAASLTTAPECADDIRTLLTPAADERDLGQAGLEVLAIILYQGPSTKATIDYVRGVNSSSTMRTLLYRGLIERHVKGREITYHASPDLLAHLGLASLTDLPELEAIQQELAAFMERNAQEAAASEDAPATA